GGVDATRNRPLLCSRWRSSTSFDFSSSPLGGNSAPAAARSRRPTREAAVRAKEKSDMTKPKDPNRVLIFDTTLRDGEQSPGISLNTQEKLEIAHQLARLGVDVIEAGFPITSPGDFEAVQAISRVVDGPVICALARTAASDIERAWEAVRDAGRPR